MSEESTDKECSNRCMVQLTLSFSAKSTVGARKEMMLLGRRTGAIMGKPVGDYVPRQGGCKVSDVIKEYYKSVEKTMKNGSGNGEDEKEEDKQEKGKNKQEEGRNKGRDEEVREDGDYVETKEEMAGAMVGKMQDTSNECDASPMSAPVEN